MVTAVQLCRSGFNRWQSFGIIYSLWVVKKKKKEKQIALNSI